MICVLDIYRYQLVLKTSLKNSTITRHILYLYDHDIAFWISDLVKKAIFVPTTFRKIVFGVTCSRRNKVVSVETRVSGSTLTEALWFIKNGFQN